MNQTPREQHTIETDPTYPTVLDRVAAVLPGMSVGAPKRNTLVLFGYVVVLLVVAGYLLQVV